MQNNKSDDFTCAQTCETNAWRLLSKEDEDRFYVHKLLYYKNLLIEQCDSWLSAEEGFINIKKQMREKRKIF